MEFFETPKGTKLPLLDLKGKSYLQVQHRLVWMREEKPDYSIETHVELEIGVAKAVIKNEQGRILATAHKSITKGRQFAIEMAETGAVGRALAMCGWGTAYCGDELEEGDEIADSPMPFLPPKSPHRETLTPSEKQISRMWAIAKNTGWSQEDVKAYFQKLGVEHSSKMTILQYNHFCKLMEEFPKNNAELSQEA